MNEDSIFLEALEQGSAEARAAFLDRACGGNAELRDSVERLLKAHERADEVLQAKAPGLPVTATVSVAERPGLQVGPYKLLEQIGEGGFGVVFMAEQHHPVRRRVALKVIKPGMDTHQVVARFEQERQALAVMDHPHIAKVLDAGTTASERPYFVMELIRGVPITQYCDEHRLAPKERLELFVSICQAVQHAHQKGIIHRDIKPTNVLVTLHDGQPLVKVIDFGVAKATGQQLTEKTLFTNFAQMIGTPLYMSPEQAELTNQDIDTRTDIYSLGVLLYELLTGTTPFEKQRFQQAAFDEIRRIIREEEPPRPSLRLSSLGDTLPSISALRHMDPRALRKLVRGDLDWIAMKALEKDRNRRYETANGLAMDVHRYLADEPVLASPPSAGYQFRKFVRRNKQAVLTVSVVSLALLLAVGTIGWALRDGAAREERASRERADREARFARERDAQRERVEQSAMVALNLSSEYLHKGNWKQSLIEARRADSVLASGPSHEELRRRVAERLSDLEMVLRVEDMGHPRDIAQAFRDYGIDIEATEIDEAAKWIARRDVRLELAFALDRWASINKTAVASSKWWADRSSTLVPWKKLLAIARAVDRDEWRNTVRAMLERDDSEGLKRIANSADVDEQPAATICLLAQALYEVQELNAAVDLLSKTQHRHLDDFRLNQKLGRLLLFLGPSRASDALRFNQAALTLRPEDLRVMDCLGAALMNNGRLDEAIAIFRSQNEWWAKANLGRALAQKGDHEEAIRRFKEAIALFPDEPWIHFSLAECQRQANDPRGAIASCRQAIKLDPGCTPAYNLLAWLLAHSPGASSSQDIRDMLAEGDRLLAEKPGDQQMRERLAARCRGLAPVLRAAGAVGEAEAAYRRSLALFLELNAASPDKYLGQASTVAESLAHMLREVKPQEAEQAYVQWVELLEKRAAKDPKPRGDLAHAYRYLGGTQWGAGRVEQAEQTFRKAVVIFERLLAEDASRIDYRFWLAATQYEIGSLISRRGQSHWPAARPWYQSAIDNSTMLTSDYLATDGRLERVNSYYWRLALNFRDSKAYAEAQQVCEQGIAFNARLCAERPDNAVFQKQLAARHIDLVEVHRRANQLTNAVQAAEKAVEIDSQSAIGHELLAWLLTTIPDSKWRDPARAVTLAKRAVDLEPGVANFRNTLGVALKNREQFQDAIDAFQKAIDLDPKFGSPHYHIAWLRATCADPKLRDPQAAVTSAQKAVGLDPTLGPYFSALGAAQYRVGDLHAAIESLHKADDLQKGADLSFHTFFLAMAHWQLGEKEQAAEWFSKAVEWMEKNDKDNPELIRFREEAENLIKMK